jgi:hypothetical protein
MKKLTNIGRGEEGMRGEKRREEKRREEKRDRGESKKKLKLLLSIVDKSRCFPNSFPTLTACAT